MDKKSTEAIATLLSKLGCLPSFHSADLFTDEIVELVGFQIRTYMNEAGRLVFGALNGHDKLEAAYKKIYGYEIRENMDDNRPNYPTTGSDSVYDLAPGTIARLLKVGTSENEFQSIVPVFIMRISEMAEEWKNQFYKMYRDADSIHEEAEGIYEDLL